jgi:hypothetical protein
VLTFPLEQRRHAESESISHPTLILNGPSSLFQEHLQAQLQHKDVEAGKGEEPSSLVEEIRIVGRRERMSGYFWKELWMF